MLGQICCDSNGKLNAQSVLLEAGIEQGGRQVPVDLSELTEYSLFPGQVIKLDVKVKGTEGFVPTSYIFMHCCEIHSTPAIADISVKCFCIVSYSIGVQSDLDEHVEAGGSALPVH